MYIKNKFTLLPSIRMENMTLTYTFALPIRPGGSLLILNFELQKTINGASE
jgi:hypothetical protein